jgi:hypothetical protein
VILTVEWYSVVLAQPCDTGGTGQKGIEYSHIILLRKKDITRMERTLHNMIT